MCYDLLECLLLHNIFMSKKLFFSIRIALTLITKSLSIQANKKCTYVVSQNESDPGY